MCTGTCNFPLRLILVQTQQVRQPLRVNLLVVRRHCADVVLHDAELQILLPPDGWVVVYKGQIRKFFVARNFFKLASFKL